MEERLSPIGRFVVVKEAVFDNNSEMGKEENVINTVSLQIERNTISYLIIHLRVLIDISTFTGFQIFSHLMNNCSELRFYI